MKIVYANISMFTKLWPQIEPTSSDLSTPITTITSFTIKKTITENVVDFDQTFKCETCNAIFNYREESRRHTIDKHESKQKKKKDLAPSCCYGMCLLYIPSDFVLKIRPPF